MHKLLHVAAMLPGCMFWQKAYAERQREREDRLLVMQRITTLPFPLFHKKEEREIEREREEMAHTTNAVCVYNTTAGSNGE